VYFFNSRAAPGSFRISGFPQFQNIEISAVSSKFSAGYASLYCHFKDNFNFGWSACGHVIREYNMQLHASTKSA
jgi:hypothetical protein